VFLVLTGKQKGIASKILNMRSLGLTISHIEGPTALFELVFGEASRHSGDKNLTTSSTEIKVNHHSFSNVGANTFM
jgi:hypothetical protein